MILTRHVGLNVQIQRIVEGGEPSAFKQYFSGWRETEDQIGLGRVFTLEQIAGEEQNMKVIITHCTFE
jgi:hypothetical protein